MHWQKCTRPFKFQIIFLGTNKDLNRKVWGLLLSQNFTSFLVDPIIFAENPVLSVKDADKGNLSEITFLERTISNAYTFSVICMLKLRFSSKINWATRKLVKFWESKRPKTFLLSSFIVPQKLIWNLRGESVFFQCIF